MQLQLDILTPERRQALEKELHELEQLTLLLAVYYPPDEYCRPDAKVKGKKPIPQAKWDAAVKRAEKAAEIKEILS